MRGRAIVGQRKLGSKVQIGTESASSATVHLHTIFPHEFLPFGEDHKYLKNARCRNSPLPLNSENNG